MDNASKTEIEFIHIRNKRSLFTDMDYYNEDGGRLILECCSLIDSMLKEYSHSNEEMPGTYIVLNAAIMTNCLTRIVRDAGLSELLDKGEEITKELIEEASVFEQSEYIQSLNIGKLRGKNYAGAFECWSKMINEFLDKNMQFKTRDIQHILLQNIAGILVDGHCS